MRLFLFLFCFSTAILSDLSEKIAAIKRKKQTPSLFIRPMEQPRYRLPDHIEKLVSNMTTQELVDEFFTPVDIKLIEKLNNWQTRGIELFEEYFVMIHCEENEKIPSLVEKAEMRRNETTYFRYNLKCIKKGKPCINRKDDNQGLMMVNNIPVWTNQKTRIIIKEWTNYHYCLRSSKLDLPQFYSKRHRLADLGYTVNQYNNFSIDEQILVDIKLGQMYEKFKKIEKEKEDSILTNHFLDENQNYFLYESESESESDDDSISGNVVEDVPTSESFDSSKNVDLLSEIKLNKTFFNKNQLDIFRNTKQNDNLILNSSMNDILRKQLFTVFIIFFLSHFWIFKMC